MAEHPRSLGTAGQSPLCELFAGYPLHWVVDQAEYATDLLFTSRAALAGLYRSLLDYAVLTFTPKDILGFLGRKWDRRFDGEVQTHYEDDRWFGTRIKHRMKTNWLKMYDKFGLILRVETVINCPKEFSVYRTRQHHDGTSSAGYYPMTKRVLPWSTIKSRRWPATAATWMRWRWWTIRRRSTNNCGNSPSPRWSEAAAMPVSIQHGAKTCVCSKRCWMATTLRVAFATAISGNRFSATRSNLASNDVPVPR